MDIYIFTERPLCLCGFVLELSLLLQNKNIKIIINGQLYDCLVSFSRYLFLQLFSSRYFLFSTIIKDCSLGLCEGRVVCPVVMFLFFLFLFAAIFPRINKLKENSGNAEYLDEEERHVGSNSFILCDLLSCLLLGLHKRRGFEVCRTPRMRQMG